MAEILDHKRLEVLIDEVFWHSIPSCKGIPFKGDLVANLGLDSLDILDLAAEFHFRFDMLSGTKESYLLQYKTAEEWMAQIHHAANDSKRRFGFFSSGSLGKPKQVWHQKHHLIEERDFWLAFTQANGVVCLSPVRHIYGFIWGLLLGTKLNQAHYLDMHEWHKVAEYASETDLIVAHPTAWQQLSPPFYHCMGISSTAPIERSVTDQLLKQQVRGMNIYGSTETGAIAWQYWEDDEFHLLPYWKRHKEGLTRGKQYFEIPDQLKWINVQEFKILGRKDEVIQIGGQNLSLVEAKQELQKIPGVKAVWVKPYEDHWGTRLYCYFQLLEEQNQADFIAKLPQQFKSMTPKCKPRKWEVGYWPYDKFEQ